MLGGVVGAGLLRRAPRELSVGVESGTGRGLCARAAKRRGLQNSPRDSEVVPFRVCPLCAYEQKYTDRTGTTFEPLGTAAHTLQ